MKNMPSAIVACIGILAAGMFLACGGAGSSTRNSQPNRQPTPTSSEAQRQTDATPTPPAPQQKEWFSGGTLHGAKMSEWSGASYADRLATSADFVTKMMQMDGKTIPPVDQIRPLAERLERNISAANKDGVADSQDVATVAATCWVLMNR